MEIRIVKRMKTFSLLFLFLSGYAYSATQISYDHDMLTVCVKTQCDRINMSASFIKNVLEGDYTIITLDSFFDNHKRYVVITPNTTSVNACSLVYSVINNRLSAAPLNIIPGQKELCNYEKHGNILINQYKDGGFWYKEYYVLKHNTYDLKYIDKDSGSETIRTFYYEGKVFNQEKIKN